MRAAPSWERRTGQLLPGTTVRARERLRLDPDLHVPHLLDVEVTSTLRRRVRLGQTDAAVATEVMADLADLAALRWDHEPLLRRVWELRKDVTPYDGVYVALTEMLDAPLITSDARLSRVRGLTCHVELLID